MRILHLVSYAVYSGPLPPTLTLALAQSRLGNTIWLGFDSRRGNIHGFEEAAAPQVDPHRLAPPWPLSLSTKSSPSEYWSDLRQIRRVLRSGEADVVHAHLSHDHGLVAFAGLGRRAAIRVRTFHAVRSLSRRLGQSWLNRQADGWIARCAQHARLAIDGFALPESRVQVIPGSIDTQRFELADAAARAGARQRFGFPADEPVLVHAALMAGRGQAELIDAIGLLGPKGPRVALVGRGEQEGELRERVRRLGLSDRIHFMGYLQGPELIAAYAAADAAFVAQAGNDASARAALEAMASGLPILAVQVGALADLIDPSIGYTIESRDPDAIAAAVRAWLQDPAAGRERGLAGRKRAVQERSPDLEARRTCQFYSDLRGES